MNISLIFVSFLLLSLHALALEYTFDTCSYKTDSEVFAECRMNANNRADIYQFRENIKANLHNCQPWAVDNTVGFNLTEFENIPLQFQFNLTYRIRGLSIADATDITTLNQVRKSLSDINPDFLLYKYSRTATVISNSLNIPYFILSPVPSNTVTSPNSFFYDDPDQLIASAARALLLLLKASSFAYIDPGKQPTSTNLLSFNDFRQTITSSSPPFSQIFLESIALNSENFFVVAVPFNETDTLRNILFQALRTGQLNPGKTVIMMNLVNSNTDLTIFRTYANVGASIFAFSVNFRQPEQFLKPLQFQSALVKDIVRLCMESVKNKFLAGLPKILTKDLIGDLRGATTTNGLITPGTYGLDAVTQKIFGFSLLIRQINAPATPIDRYIFNGTVLTDSNVANSTKILNDTVIRIAVIITTGYFMQKPNVSGVSNPGQYYGFSIGLLAQLQKLATFNYTFVFPPDGATGEVPNNGTNVGIVKMLIDGTADMSIIPMVTDNIDNVVTKSDIPLSAMTINMLTRPPKVDVSLTHVLLPFGYNVWLSILAMFVIMSFAYWSIDAISKTFPLEPDFTNSKSKLNAEHSFLVVYSSFVTAKLKINPVWPSTQIFAFVMWFSTLAIVITYASNLLPFFMRTNAAYSFKRMSDLTNNLKRNNFQWSFVRGSIDVSLLLKDPTVAHLVNQSLKEWPNETYVSDLDSPSVVTKNRFILIQNGNKNSYIYNNVCTTDLLMGNDRSYSNYIVMRSKWPQLREMNSLISKLSDSNILNGLVTLYFGSGKCAQGLDLITPSPQVLSLDRLVGLFIIPLIGVVFGVLYVLITLCVAKIKRYRELSEQEKFVVGSVYDGNINSLEENGAWVVINGRSRPYFLHSSSLNPDLKKILSPKELNIQLGEKIKLKYFGKDPISKNKRFCKDFEQESVV